MLTLIKPVRMGQSRRAASQVARPPERRRSGCDWQRPPAIEGCVGSSAYCGLYARECVSFYSHMKGDAVDPAVVIRVPGRAGPGERSWVAVTRGRTGARGAGHRSAPPLRPCQPWRRLSGPAALAGFWVVTQASKKRTLILGQTRTRSD